MTNSVNYPENPQARVISTEKACSQLEDAHRSGTSGPDGLTSRSKIRLVNGAHVNKTPFTAPTMSKPEPRLNEATKAHGSVALPSKSKTPVWLRVIATIYIAIILYTGLVTVVFVQVATWVLLFPMLLCFPIFKEKIMGSIARHSAAITAFHLNPFWKVELVAPPGVEVKNHETSLVTGMSHWKRPKRGLLVMSNHMSSVDPWVVNFALMKYLHVKYVFKASLYKIPVAGCGLYLSGDIPVHFTHDKGGWGTKPGSVAAMMKRCTELLNMGLSTMIFPEGTRSRCGRLQPFRDGFFKFAMQENCDILPIVIHNSSSLWPLKGRLLDIGTAYAAIGTPLRPEGKSLEDLKEEVKDSMLHLLTFAPTYDSQLEPPIAEAPATRGQGL